ncbi:hypothetical protein [Cognatishimia sp. MH4019]|uniref:hypothetical protein n=1 Tax=Cognatishimia sp. MH4019 TaxID=2854030 RepID=UPI001CD75A6B|nr:hypothetical protein [Cognatishimia sp. MH4019]
MNIDIFVAGLVGVTFVAVLIFALTSKKKTQERMADDDAPKSSLAADSNDHRRADY